MGYGARALQALNSYYSGEYFSFNDTAPREEHSFPNAAAFDPVSSANVMTFSFTYTPGQRQSTNLLEDNPTVRAPNAMPPLLQRLSERKPEHLDYLGVSYGLTPSLLRFIFLYSE